MLSDMPFSFIIYYSRQLATYFDRHLSPCFLNVGLKFTSVVNLLEALVYMCRVTYITVNNLRESFFSLPMFYYTPSKQCQQWVIKFVYTVGVEPLYKYIPKWSECCLCLCVKWVVHASVKDWRGKFNIIDVWPLKNYKNS